MSQQKTAPKPPDSLGKAGKKFWNAVLSEYELVDAHHQRLLENACLCLDRQAAARETISVEGIVTQNRFQETREHPAVNVERQAMQIFRQTVRELGLDLDGGPVECRGPRRPGTRN